MPEKPATAIVTLQQGASYTLPDGMKFLLGKPKTVVKRSKIEELKRNPRFAVSEVAKDEDLNEAMAKTHRELGQVEEEEAAKAKVKKKKIAKKAVSGKKKKKLKKKKGTK